MSLLQSGPFDGPPAERPSSYFPTDFREIGSRALEMLKELLKTPVSQHLLYFYAGLIFMRGIAAGETSGVIFFSDWAH